MKYLTPLFLFFLASCFHVRKPAQNPAFLEPILIDAEFVSTQQLHCLASVQYFYDVTKNELAWFDSAGLSRDAHDLMEVIRQIETRGLDAADYHADKLLVIPDSLSRSERKTLDVLLTDAYLNLFTHLAHGRLDSSMTTRRDLSLERDTSAAELLSRVLRAQGVTGALLAREPDNDQYRAMCDTLRALSVSSRNDSLTAKLKQSLAINIERLKSYAAKPFRYLHVNIPAFRMSVVEGDSILLESNVIVGKPTNATPELQSVIKSFTIYPYWHVPRSIATKEILPMVQQDSVYLVNHNFEVLNRSNEVVDPSSVDWASLSEDYFPYTLRQREGRENSLGIIKFTFNNSFGVYLHDTNSRRLFKKEKRALSHGCVRVHKALELAHYLVKDDSVYITADDLDQYLSFRQRVQIKVVNPLPVFLEYLTCEVRNGNLIFYEDIYLKDEQIANALWPQEKINL